MDQITRTIGMAIMELRITETIRKASIQMGGMAMPQEIPKMAFNQDIVVVTTQVNYSNLVTMVIS
jgi:hypothetical protein